MSDENINKQTEQLREILWQNQKIKEILEKAALLQAPDWYLAGGCISQTVWNKMHGFKPENGILDYDLVYYDPSDTSYEKEDFYIQKSKKVFGSLAELMDIKNEARVHLWFEGHFGFKIPPYKSAEDAISKWATTAACVGVRYENNRFDVYAPHGLDNIFEMIIKPVNQLFTKEMYEAKIGGWLKVWPKLKVVPWDGK